MAVAELNRTAALLEKLGRSRGRKAVKSGAVSLDQIVNVPISAAGEGQELSAGDLRDFSVDSVEWWLRRALELQTGHKNPEKDILLLVKNASAFFSIERGISNFWQQVLWEGWCLRKKGAVLVHTPGDKALETLRHAWTYRHEARFSQPGLLAINEWRFQLSLSANRP